MTAKAQTTPSRSRASDAAVKAAAARWVARRDAGLSPVEQAELDSWLSADSRHRTELGRYDAAWGALNRPAARGTVDAVLENLVLLDRRQRRRRLTATAAACLVLLGVGTVWQFRLRSAAAPELAASSAVVVLPERRTLADGSVVELRPGADIATAFTPDQRRVILRRGEAHFQVTKDSHRPFVVDSGGVQVRAVGTAFTVQRGSTEIEVVVTEGRVAVDRTNPSTTEHPAPPMGLGSTAQTIALLDAGSRIVVPQELVATLPEVTPVSALELDQRMAWRAPRLEFTGTPLSQAVAMLNKYADPVKGVHFVLGDESLAPVEVSGLFRADNADAFVGLLEGGFGIKAERRGDHEVVLRRAR